MLGSRRRTLDSKDHAHATRVRTTIQSRCVIRVTPHSDYSGSIDCIAEPILRLPYCHATNSQAPKPHASTRVYFYIEVHQRLYDEVDFLPCAPVGKTNGTAKKLQQGMLQQMQQGCSLCHEDSKVIRTGSWQRALTTSIIPGSLCSRHNTGRRPFMLYRGLLVHEGSSQRRETTSIINGLLCPLVGVTRFFFCWGKAK